jgi:hypothetical protein
MSDPTLAEQLAELNDGELQTLINQTLALRQSGGLTGSAAGKAEAERRFGKAADRGSN